MNNKKFLLYTPLFFALFFLATIPFNLRKIFNFEKIEGLEGFREHISFSLFGFDILLLLFFLVSIFAFFYSGRSLRKEFSFKKGLKSPLTIFIFWIFLTISWSEEPTIALYHSIRMLAAILAFLALRNTLQYKRRFFIYAASTIFGAGILQAIIGILQFIFQKSLGLKLLGESDISRTILGVAKFEISGTKIIRAYGTFPHPNLFGAFLLLALAAGVWLILFVNFSKRSRILNIFMPISLAIILAGMALSYSRSVIIVLLVFIFMIAFAHKKRFISIFKQACERFKIPKTLQEAVGILLIFSVLFVSYNILSTRICFNKCGNDNSIDLRFKYIETATSIITKYPLHGVGIGNFITFQKKHFSKKLHPWEQQPVHNIYFLIASEVGLIGFIAFLYIIISYANIFQKGFFGRLHNPFVLCFFGFLILGLIDHYFWTLPQGMLIFWISLAFFCSSAKITKVEKKPKKT